MQDAQRNCVVLTARIVATPLLRHTPAGMAAVDLDLEHSSVQQEAGGQRQVAVTLRAVAFGSLAQRLAQQAAGSVWTFTGFLASLRTARGLSCSAVLHIQDIQPH